MCCPVPHVYVNEQKRTARVVVQRCAEVRLVPRMLLMLLSVVLRVLLVRVLVCRGRRQAPQPEQ